MMYYPTLVPAGRMIGYLPICRSYLLVQ